MKNNNRNKAFTLVELLVVITIMTILSMMVYAPYQHFQTKQKVRNSAKMVSQTLYESRNLAINGSLTGTGNSSIGVLFASGSEDISIFQYPYGQTIGDYEDPNFEYEKKQLERGVTFSGTGYLLIYDAITGSGRYLEEGSPYTNSDLDITVGFGGSSSGNMTKKVRYYTNTYVADVQ